MRGAWPGSAGIPSTTCASRTSPASSCNRAEFLQPCEECAPLAQHRVVASVRLEIEDRRLHVPDLGHPHRCSTAATSGHETEAGRQQGQQLGSTRVADDVVVDAAALHEEGVRASDHSSSGLNFAPAGPKGPTRGRLPLRLCTVSVAFSRRTDLRDDSLRQRDGREGGPEGRIRVDRPRRIVPSRRAPWGVCLRGVPRRGCVTHDGAIHPAVSVRAVTNLRPPVEGPTARRGSASPSASLW